VEGAILFRFGVSASSDPRKVAAGVMNCIRAAVGTAGAGTGARTTFTDRSPNGGTAGRLKYGKTPKMYGKNYQTRRWPPHMFKLTGLQTSYPSKRQ
jgi:hypothetical protein